MRSIKGKRVLVTGGAGFIGSHLVDSLLAAGAERVVVLDNFFLGKPENLHDAQKNYSNVEIYRDDARHFGVVQAVLEKENIQVVFNMATIALNYSFFNPFDSWMVNIEVMNTLLELLKMGAYETLIHTSSSEAYGTARYKPMDERHPLDPTTPYAAGKAAADMMAISLQYVTDLDISVIRPFNNYGPRQNDGLLAAVIPLTAHRILNGEKPMLEGTGEQTRDFMYVTDTAKAHIMAYENENCRGRIVNIGSGVETSMKELIGKIMTHFNYTGEIDQRPARTSDVVNLCADISLAKELINFKPKVGLDEGLKITLDWYASQGGAE